jgi:hypothetical protein
MIGTDRWPTDASTVQFWGNMDAWGFAVLKLPAGMILVHWLRQIRVSFAQPK